MKFQTPKMTSRILLGSHFQQYTCQRNASILTNDHYLFWQKALHADHRFVIGRAKNETALLHNFKLYSPPPGV